VRLILCLYRIDLGCRPGGVFHRARHYNVLAGSNRAETIETARKRFGLAPSAVGQTSDTYPA